MTFQIQIQPANLHYEVEREETLLAAAIRQGITLPYGCRDGACGSCKSRLIEGRVIHGAHQLSALSAEEEEAGIILTCCATPQTDCVVEARGATGAGTFQVLKMPARVSSLTKAAPDVMIMRLQLPANASFRFKAGQYIDFLLRDGSRRSYSMANAPLMNGPTDQIELHLRHMNGGNFTETVFTTMKEKDILRVEGPFGSFYLREETEKPMILLASGTGFAPLKALIEDMKAKNIQRPSTLYWGCRTKPDLYMHEWALEAAQSLPWLTYVPVLSEPDADWSGRSGLVHEAVLADKPDLSAYEVYACGAPVMVQSALQTFTNQAGLPTEAFFSDAFTSAADKLKASAPSVA